MNEITEKALREMPVITKIINADIGELDKYYILKWYISGWRDERWVEIEIEYRKMNPLTELKKS